jgi:hypothetical protein
MNRPQVDVFGQTLLEDPPHDPNCILSQVAASTEGLLAWKWALGTGDRGRQGKSAAFGRAHVVGGVEVLRGIENGQAVAPFQIVKETNAPKAIGQRKFAVKPS